MVINKMQNITAFHLKIIAIIGMTMNHTVHALGEQMPLWLQLLLNAGGGLTFPIMAFFLVEGYRHTSNLNRYMLRVFVFALISQAPFVIAMGIAPYMLNIMFTLLLGLLLLRFYEKQQATWVRVLVAVPVLFISIWFDWGAIGLFVIMLYYVISDERKRRTIPGSFAGVMMLVLHSLAGDLSFFSFSIGCFIAIPLLLRYRGERGRKMKYLFYIYYPLHLAVLAVLVVIAKGLSN
ncbi:MAG: conjugal transfer protein TraX [Lachnospiraceae bacterium]|nr:conjugal transfer protein TraX [Lachnospiraceae bacterium]